MFSAQILPPTMYGCAISMNRYWKFISTKAIRNASAVEKMEPMNFVGLKSFRLII